MMSMYADDQINCLQKREQFAISLRKQKKDQILKMKRKNLSHLLGTDTDS